MNKPLLSTLFLSLFGFSAIKAQDVHFTQFTQVPTQINAAQIGGFFGTYRIGALYRGQWLGGNSTTKGFQTPVFYADGNLPSFRKQDWIGVGVNLYQDKRGVAGLVDNSLQLGISYHIGLDNVGNSVLSIGARGGTMQRRIDENALRFQDGILNGGTSEEAARLENNGKNTPDYAVGISYTQKLSKTQKLQIGIGIEHLTAPKNSLFTADSAQAKGVLPRRLALSGQYDWAFAEKLTLTPALLLQTSGGLFEANAQAMIGYQVATEGKNKDLILRAGAGYRLRDAVLLLAGADFKNIRVGVGYDFTTSQLRSQSQLQDAFEISVGYIGKIFKIPNPTPVILCPHF